MAQEMDLNDLSIHWLWRKRDGWCLQKINDALIPKRKSLWVWIRLISKQSCLSKTSFSNDHTW